MPSNDSAVVFSFKSTKSPSNILHCVDIFESDSCCLPVWVFTLAEINYSLEKLSGVNVPNLLSFFRTIDRIDVSSPFVSYECILVHTSGKLSAICFEELRLVKNLFTHEYEAAHRYLILAVSTRTTAVLGHGTFKFRVRFCRHAFLNAFLKTHPSVPDLFSSKSLLVTTKFWMLVCFCNDPSMAKSKRQSHKEPTPTKKPVRGVCRPVGLGTSVRRPGEREPLPDTSVTTGWVEKIHEKSVGPGCCREN